MTESSNSARNLLAAPPRIINVGLESFAREIAGNGATVQQVNWQPPGRGDAALARLLAKLGT